MLSGMSADLKLANAFKLLDLSPKATLGDLERAYRLVMLKWHPNRNLGHEADVARKCYEFNEAKETIKTHLDQLQNESEHDASKFSWVFTPGDSKKSSNEQENIDIHLNFQRFIMALSKLDSRRRYIYFHNNYWLINTLDKLKQALEKFDDKIQPEIIARCEYVIKEADAVVQLMSVLHPDRRYPFITKYLPMLKADDDINSALDLLTDRFKIRVLHSLVSLDIINGAVILNFIPHLDKDEIIALIVKYGHRCTTAVQVRDIMLLLQDDQRQIFFGKIRHTFNTAADILMVLKCFESSELQFALLCQHSSLVRNGTMLAQLLIGLNRVTVADAKEFKQVFRSWADMFVLVKIFDHSERLTLLNEFAPSFFQGYEFISDMARLLPADYRLTFYQRFQKELPVDQLARMFSLLPENTHLQALTFFAGKITNYQILQSALVNVPNELHLPALLQFNHLVNKPKYQRHFLKSLPVQDQFHFVNINQDLVVKPTSSQKMFASLAAPASLHYAISKNIVAQLDSYQRYRFKLHANRVNELREAVIASTSIQEIYQLILQQIDLMNGPNTARAYPDVSQRFYLNHQPGKKVISIGYRALLENCRLVLADNHIPEVAVVAAQGRQLGVD